MRAVPDQVAPYVEADWSSLGTDGFGLSDTRSALRRHFHVDPLSIVVRVLQALASRKTIPPSVLSAATRRYGFASAKVPEAHAASLQVPRSQGNGRPERAASDERSCST
jgi:pyruvate dehydrogenase complex dehydrogenase (E1) component